jgi:hypothetical protein
MAAMRRDSTAPTLLYTSYDLPVLNVLHHFYFGEKYFSFNLVFWQGSVW